MHIGRLNSRVPAARREPALEKMPTKPREMFLEIAKKDVGAFYNLKTGIVVQDKRAYSVVMGSYSVVKRAVRFVILGLWNGAKTINKAVR